MRLVTPEEAEKMLQSFFSRFACAVHIHYVVPPQDEVTLCDDITKLQGYREEGITSFVGRIITMDTIFPYMLISASYFICSTLIFIAFLYV